MALIPQFRAPSISASKLSPIMIQLEAVVFTFSNAYSKTFLFGFLTPTDYEVIIASKKL